MSSYPVKRILKRDNYICAYCDGPATEIDHIVPQNHGGTHEDNNLVAACSICNSVAGGQLFSSLAEKRKYIKLHKRRIPRHVPPYDKAYPRHTYRVSDDTHKRLKDIAAEHSVTLNGVLRYALHLFIQEYDSGKVTLPIREKTVRTIIIIE